MEKEIKNILITGASGFIGNRLLQVLNKHDRYFLLSRKNKPEWQSLPENFRVVQGSLENLDALHSKFENMDVIVNLAAELRDETQMERTNIEGVKSLCRLAEMKGVKKIVHLSSVGVIGMQYSKRKVIIDEKSECNPSIPYEKTKLKSEEILLEFTKSKDLELVILRPTNVFGDAHPKNVLLNLVQKIKKGGKFPVSGQAKVNYVYVEDLIAFIQYSIQHAMKGKIYTVGLSEDLRKFIVLISDNLQKKTGFIEIPHFFINLLEFAGYFGWKSLRMKMRNISNLTEYDGNLISRETGIKYHLEAGIKNTVEYYQKSGLLE